MYILITGEVPFKGANQRELFERIKKQEPNFNLREFKGVSEQCIDLLNSLLEKDPEKRISANDALKHGFFTDYLNENDVIPEKEENSKKFKEKINSVYNKNEGNPIKENVITYLALNCMDEEEENEIEYVFNQLCYNNGQGIATKDQFIEFFLMYNTEISKKAAKKYFNRIDKNKSGFIEYKEFLREFCDHKKLLSNENLKEVYNLFDSDKDNKISWDDIMEIMYPGEIIPQKLVTSLYASFGKKPKDLISFEEFKEIVLKN